MRSLNLLILSFVISGTATAGTEFSSDLTPYEQLVQWYSQARSITFKDSEGLYKGKCFKRLNDSVQDGVLSVVKNPVDDLDRGPAFPPIMQRKVGVLDVNRPFNKTEALDYIRTIWNQLKRVLEGDHSPLYYQQMNLMGEVKIYEDYLITVHVLSEPTECHEQMSDEWKEICKLHNNIVPVGTPVGACYFYDEVE